MSSSERSQLLERLQSKEFRDALVAADIANGILFQLRAMLEERGWKQDELAQRAGTAQPVVSKYMRGYDNFSVKTLKALASAFDVSLTVRFERFSELVNRYLHLDRADLTIPSFTEDVALHAPASEYSFASSMTAAGPFQAELLTTYPSPVIISAGQGALHFGTATPDCILPARTTREQKEEDRYANVA